jgi:hypothetical protein
MKKYKVIRTCHGFKGRLWEEGQIVELEDDETPPSHFVDYFSVEPKKEEPVIEKKDPQKPMPIEVGKPIKPEGGFASSVENDLPKPIETAAQAKSGRSKTKK